MVNAQLKTLFFRFRYFLKELREVYPQYKFEIVGVHERAQKKLDLSQGKKDPRRVIIYVDNDNIIVEMPRNG